MKFNRRFYDDHINLRQMSKRRLLVAIFIGLASGVVIYSFSYIIREVSRVISFSYDLYPNILNETDRNFYNLFFAGLSLILGNSIALSFIFSRPQKLMSRRGFKRKRIVNEQIFLGFNFAHWFAKLGFMFGAFAICCVEYPIWSDSRYIIAGILIIALYLESWKTLNKVLKRRKWKFMLVHAIVLCLLSLGLSRVNLTNYKAIDQIALEANPVVDLPTSFYYRDTQWRYPQIDFKVIKNNDGKIVIKNEEGNTIEMHKIPSEIARKSLWFREELRDYLEIRLSIDKTIKLNYVKQIEANLYASGYYMVGYVVYNENPYTRNYNQQSFRNFITNHVLQFRPGDASSYPPIPEPFLNNRSFKDSLNVHVGNEIVIDSLVVPHAMLIRKFKNYISKETVVNYIISEETTYQEYITALSAQFRAAHDLREKEQTVFDEFKSSEAYIDEREELRYKYPINTIDTYKRNNL
ncbi:hypothetical protein [uncultured Psychroserpens sp.]|uniref:hypothetical protein n=1 Tax=uncultured Psychroserpens sp. TaxID=255436 RepID=UPI002617B997|nr:hypothetical protein [uncultured Psychroserpens sp.]